jgi:hypothetical protein
MSMTDREIMKTLFETSKNHHAVLERIEFRVFVALNVCRTLIDAAPNKDVLRAAFARTWTANDGPKRAAEVNAQDLNDLKLILGPLQDVIE